MGRLEQDYREALDGLRFSGAGKERIMKNLMEREKRRTVRPLRAALIAAAMVLVCVLMIAAAMPGQVFKLISGADASFQQVSEGRSVVEISGEMPLQKENGRLWLVIGGERTDITDSIDLNTPYVYDNTDPETGRRDYLVVGGTIEDYGWLEFYEMKNGEFAVAGENANNSYCVMDGVTYDYIHDLTEEQRLQVDQKISGGLMDSDSVFYVWKPWYLNAVGQLAGLGVPSELLGYPSEQ